MEILKENEIQNVKGKHKFPLSETLKIILIIENVV